MVMSYPHTCIITRPQSGTDDKGNLLPPSVIYEGECDYQVGSGAGLDEGILIARSPSLFIPSYSVALKQNDDVKITLLNDRVLVGIIADWESRDFGRMFGRRHEGDGGTEIWLDDVKRNG